MLKRVRVKVCNIKRGDEFVHVGAGWVALDDAQTTYSDEFGVAITLKVRYNPDGGIGFREWSDADQEIKITRGT
jgi:hypothetical protein